MCLLADHWLKGIQHLERRLETDGSRRDFVVACRLSHDRTDQVVRQDVRPNLLADKFWRLAAQQIHLESDLDRPQVELRLPVIMPPKRKTVSGAGQSSLASPRAREIPMSYFFFRTFGVVNSAGIGRSRLVRWYWRSRANRFISAMSARSAQ